MAFGSTPTDVNNIPIGSLYVPGTGFKAIQGGAAYTDGSSNDSSPVRVELASPSQVTYVSSIFGLASAATATDIFTLTGSSTKTVKVIRFVFSMTATAIGLSMMLIKRSTADTAGTTTSTGLTTGPMDSNDAGASATILAYTANPTVGTLVGNFFATRYAAQPAGGSTPTPILEVDWGTTPGQMPTLRGTGEVFAVNFNSVTVSSPVINITVMWTEE